MKNIAKRGIEILLVLVTMFAMCTDVFAGSYRILYAEDGRSKAFPESKVEAQLTVGWYTEPVQRLYAPGKSKVFKKSQVAAQLTVGWSTEPFVLMTALDGRTKYVEKAKVAANKKVGWYEGKPVKVYAEDGRTKYISSVDVAINEKVGWYTEPVQRLYAPGKSKVFKKSQIAAQLKVGWYTYPVTTVYSESGVTKVVKTADLKTWASKGWLAPVVNGELNEAYCYRKIMAKKSEFYEGMPWTNDNYYGWNAGIYSGGFGCAGFAFLLSDAAFGDLPARMVSDDITIAKLRVGDILRINGDTHSVVVLEKHNDYIVIAEGNFNWSIHWGRKLYKSQVEAADYYITRYLTA